MRSFMACHIPDRQSGYKIGFDQVSPLASSISKRSEYEIMKIPREFYFILARSRWLLDPFQRKITG